MGAALRRAPPRRNLRRRVLVAVLLAMCALLLIGAVENLLVVPTNTAIPSLRAKAPARKHAETTTMSSSAARPVAAASVGVTTAPSSRLSSLAASTWAPTPANGDLHPLDFECPLFDEMPHIKGCQIQCTMNGCSKASKVCDKVGVNSCSVSTNADRTWATLKSLQHAHRPESGDLQYLMKGQNPDAAVQMIRTWGWKDSTLRPSAVQSHPGNECFDAVGTCSDHGENLLGRCFCIPGWTGTACGEPASKATCTNKDDLCFWTPAGGVFMVSIDRWRAAQEAELGVWSSGGMKSLDPKSGDRIAEHMQDFNQYADVGPIGADLGVFLEVGSGPWTQSLPMLTKREFTVQKYVLLEPGALDYSCNVDTCVYKGGSVKSHPKLDGKVVVISAGGEHLDLFKSTFDTIMMVNVLEHVLNGVRILRELFNALKPGGVLIFNDRWWDHENRGSGMSMDVLFHPIRMHKSIFDAFLNGFETIYRRTMDASAAGANDGHKYKGIYFIGRKKRSADLCT